MSYSQNAEEHYILAACPEPAGRFLDIGAWHPTEKSNTRALFERGWVGVMVEPSPGPFANLQAEYGNVERITLIQSAVVSDPSITAVSMWISDDALSTTEQPNYEKWRNHAEFKGKEIVPAVWVGDLLDYGEPNFVSIDTEGTSVEVLLAFLETGSRPRCICVEHDGQTGEVMRWAGPLGYAVVYQSGENLVLVR